jgi:mannobiose 2-epimerase
VDTQSDRFTRNAAIAELERLGRWWLAHAPDERNDGFVGEIDADGNAVGDANKGLVLHCRLLWFFSEMLRFTGQADYAAAAERAYRFLVRHFEDRVHGGAFWALSPTGQVISDRKQTYAQCFCVYALVAYYRATAEAAALSDARGFLDAIDKHAADRDRGGLVEAFARDWGPIEDMRLGADDMNAPKTMNTHLHFVEAMAALHRVAPDERSAAALRHGLELFANRIVAGDGHLGLYFDADWRSLSDGISFGHDIEASWLLSDAAEVLGDPALAGRLRPVTSRLAATCIEEGIAPEGQLCQGYDPPGRRRDETGVWWVQAEALVGFLHAFRQTGEARYRHAADGIWRFVRRQLIDAQAGEWRWSAPAQSRTGAGRYLAGFWKGPYHNGRAMLESIRLLEAADAE